MAAAEYRHPDDEAAIAALMKRWNLGLNLTMAERRMALRTAREQIAITLPPTPEPEESPLPPSLARVLGHAEPTPGEDEEDDLQPYAGPAAGDDDDEDELDVAEPDDDFYADALEDV